MDGSNSPVSTHTPLESPSDAFDPHSCYYDYAYHLLLLLPLLLLILTLLLLLTLIIILITITITTRSRHPTLSILTSGGVRE